MLLKNSRYQPHRPFEPDSSFRGVGPRAVTTAEGMIEHRVVEGERLDTLARHYFNDDRLWWRILDANPELQHADALLGEDWIGRAILIPQRKG
ncbi:hypothetical protein [Marinobacterium rhizophilum]|uniref:LysM domain-containing protein n=1 Tax=Marinobacterium rhizophilum TaxID=420402 RepID=A0ABY5HHL1_9GAMM|nr:hypothetical protein [Marinobacterium rhizophilum]UTW11336.1 hypothetical protein KDW95_19035 [Marinobacterium rhizophilum]